MSLALLASASVLITGCDPCADLDKEPAIAPVQPAPPQVRVAVTTEALSGLAAVQRPLARGTRRVRKVEQDGQTRTLVATAGARGALLMDDPDASPDCPACAILQVRMDFDLATGPSPLLSEPDRILGGARATIRIPVHLQIVPLPAVGGAWDLITAVAPGRELVVAPPQVPEGFEPAVDEAIAALVTEVAKFDAVKLTGHPLLRLRGWAVRDPALALGEPGVRVDGRLVMIDGTPAGPIAGPGVVDLEVAPGLGQDLTWGIAPAYLAALADDAGAEHGEVLVDGAPHRLQIRSIGGSSKGVRVGLRARRAEGCGWIELEADEVRGTSDAHGGLKVIGGDDLHVGGTGGASTAGAGDPGFHASVSRRVREVVADRLGHALVQGPAGQRPTVVIVRHGNDGAVFADLTFPARARRRPPSRPMPEDFSKLPTVKLPDP